MKTKHKIRRVADSVLRVASSPYYQEVTTYMDMLTSLKSRQEPVRSRHNILDFDHGMYQVMKQFFFVSHLRTYVKDGWNRFPDGNEEFYQNGILGRLDGPSIIYPNGSRKWLYEGLLHREDGPAIEEINVPGQRDIFYWYIDGRYITKSVNIKEGQRRFIRLRDQGRIESVIDE